MFDEIPSRRISERRHALKDALIAALSIIAGSGEAIRKERVDWETLMWEVVLIAACRSYWKKRHPDPWSPPLRDNEGDHFYDADKADLELTAKG